jgi:hypothetical protein
MRGTDQAKEMKRRASSAEHGGLVRRSKLMIAMAEPILLVGKLIWDRCRHCDQTSNVGFCYREAPLSDRQGAIS